MVIAYVPIQQQILRHRAERLLSDIRDLQLRHSTWADAQGLMNRWGAWGQYEGTCTPQDCTYTIVLSDLLINTARRHPPLANHLNLLRRPYSLLGGRGAQIRAHVTVIDGVVWGKGFALFTEFPSTTSDVALTLIGSSDSVSHFMTGSHQSQLLLHKNYVVGWPSGCTYCIAIYSEFTPYADPRDVLRLMDFNLACLTQRNACREKADIMPDAWELATKDERYTDALWKQVQACDYPAELLGRDTENAVVADVVSSKVVDGVQDRYQVSEFRLVRRLKHSEFWQPNAIEKANVFEGTVSRTTHNEPSDVLPGKRFILLFRYTNAEAYDLRLDPCGAMPLTQQNLEDVQRGIDQDFKSRISTR
jgi:hypothetical protein